MSLLLTWNIFPHCSGVSTVVYFEQVNAGRVDLLNRLTTLEVSFKSKILRKVVLRPSILLLLLLLLALFIYFTLYKQHLQ